MKIPVTSKHIKNGKCGDFYKCPIALALKEATGKRYGVGIQLIWLKDTHQLMSTKVANFVRDYDSRQPVKPFMFNIV